MKTATLKFADDKDYEEFLEILEEDFRDFDITTELVEDGVVVMVRRHVDETDDGDDE